MKFIGLFAFSFASDECLIHIFFIGNHLGLKFGFSFLGPSNWTGLFGFSRCHMLKHGNVFRVNHPATLRATRRKIGPNVGFRGIREDSETTGSTGQIILCNRRYRKHNFSPPIPFGVFGYRWARCSSYEVHNSSTLARQKTLSTFFGEFGDFPKLRQRCHTCSPKTPPLAPKNLFTWEG